MCTNWILLDLLWKKALTFTQMHCALTSHIKTWQSFGDAILQGPGSNFFLELTIFFLARVAFLWVAGQSDPWHQQVILPHTAAAHRRGTFFWYRSLKGPVTVGRRCFPQVGRRCNIIEYSAHCQCACNFFSNAYLPVTELLWSLPGSQTRMMFLGSLTSSIAKFAGASGTSANQNSRATVRTELWFEWPDLLQGGISEYERRLSHIFIYF